MTARRNPALRVLGLLGLLAALQITTAEAALAWWNSDWTYRVKVDADTSAKGANIASPIGHARVLLRLHTGNFNFTTAKDDGSDLRVVAGDDKTPLHFQIEKFDGLVDEVALIWVDVPDLAPNATTSLYIYWGNKNAVSGSDGKATFGGDDLLVYHFGEENGLPHDTTSYGNTALTGGKRVDGGMIGSGLRLDGKTPVHLPQSPSLAMTAGQPMTWSMWVHPDDGVAGGVLYDDKDAGSELTFGIDNHVAYAQLVTSAGTQRTSAGTAVPATGWHLITVTASDHLSVYVDGQKSGEAALSLPALNGAALLGGSPDVTPPAPTSPDASAPATTSTAIPSVPTQAARPDSTNFVGIIDEFRVTKALVAPGVMLAQVAAEGPTPKLVALETPEQSSVFGSGYIGIILKSVTPDAWVVIGLLGVMSVISWIVMISKAVYVTRITAANAAFRHAYNTQVHGAHGDLLGVMRRMQSENQPAWRGSSLYRLNDVATSEIDDRLNGGRVTSDGMLASQSIAAIRSALDGRMTFEVQRLNRMMVLLTIAIAGGPFIGLLGTVIGVMITFAAIAQAGDVNVNAIAPGISAALLATVAGLAVAIPALFGYNYFNSRITDTIADMAVHIDTLVTRMGEGLLGRRTPAAGE